MQANKHRWTFAIVLAAAMSGAAVSPSSAQLKTPLQPPRGQLGGEGPCSVPAKLDVDGADVDILDNPSPTGEWSNSRVYVVRPNGTGSPRTGGRCDDARRPVVVLIHGWPADQLLPGFDRTKPSQYEGLVRNFVSNGNIVVFPTYDWAAILNLEPPYEYLFNNVNLIGQIVTSATELVMVPGLRMDRRHLGVFGHSLGGGIAHRALNMLVGGHPDWGSSSRWLALDAATNLYIHCHGITNPFAVDPDYDYEANCEDLDPPPANTLMLYITQRGDEVTQHIATWRLYEDMPIPIARKWGVIIPNDCSHSDGLACADERGALARNQACPQDNAATKECAAGHLLPTRFSDRNYWPARTYNHLNFYGLYRNLQALAECARSSASPSCQVDRTYMGVWSDGEAATPAENYPPR